MDKISFKSKLIANAFDQMLNRAVASAGLTSAQAYTLGYLAHRVKTGSPPPCQHDIETQFHVTHPTATGILSRLNEKGFVTFFPDENDKRLKRVVITPAGLDVTRSIMAKMDDTDAALTDGLSEEDVIRLNGLLDTVVKNVFEKTGFIPPKGDSRT